MKWKKAVLQTNMATEPPQSRENLNKRYRPGYINQNKVHIVGTHGVMSRGVKLEEFIWCDQRIRHPRAGRPCGNSQIKVQE